LNKADLIRRSFYIVISLAGMSYEFIHTEEVRWPLMIGYAFIIIATVYSFFAQGLKQDEENL